MKLSFVSISSLLLFVSLVDASPSAFRALLSLDNEGTSPIRALQAVPPGCTIQTGVDYVDNDIGNVPAPKATDCCTICSGTAGCGAFSWSNYNGGTCWLKSAKGNTNANPAVTSGTVAAPTCSIQNGVDYVDNDIGRAKSATASGCCNICKNWGGCRAFSWNNFEGGTCWLKNAKGQTVMNAAVQSAEVSTSGPPCTLEYGVDYVDNDIGNTYSPTPGGCCSICQSWTNCRSFSWTSLNGGTCWLKSAKGSTVLNGNVVSSQVLPNPPPCTITNGVDYVDHDIGNVQRSSAEQCCDACRAKSGCNFFSWSNYLGGTCWLKSAKMATVSNPGVRSGGI